MSRRRRGGLGSSKAKHTGGVDNHISSGRSQAQRGLMAAEEGRCKVAYEAISAARWDNGAAWAHRNSGGRAPQLQQFDQELQHANDTFRNRCLPR